MIVAIANQSIRQEKIVVANSLALLRVRDGRKVMLLNTAPRTPGKVTQLDVTATGLRSRLAECSITGRTLVPELELLRRRYNDIVIDTECRDTAESRTALIAARLVVVPVTPKQADLASQYQLISKLNSARMFNPGLRVLFVMVGEDADPSNEEQATVRAYVARVMSATLAGTIIHGQDPKEMEALYREVFNH